MRAIGGCLRCGRRWYRWWARFTGRDAGSHVTDYAVGQGMFPLCERCWTQLTPTERLPFYRHLWRTWLPGAVDDGDRMDELLDRWSVIEAAVLAGR